VKPLIAEGWRNTSTEDVATILADGRFELRGVRTVGTHDEMGARAAVALRQAGVTGEVGLAVAEGFATSRAQGVEDLLGDVIPGASALVKGSKRVVVVTAKSIYLLRGTRYDKVAERIKAYPLGGAEAVMTYDGKAIRFPDGQAVFLARQAAKLLTDAAGVTTYAGMAAQVMQDAGISGERPVLVERGSVPKPTTAGSKAHDAVFGGGELDVRSKITGRLVLLTDRSIYVIDAHHAGGLTTGEILKTYPRETTVLAREDKTLRFPDGETIDFRDPSEPQRLVDMAKP
jgi:hypothetical protein